MINPANKDEVIGMVSKSGSRIVVHKEVYHKFVEKFKTAASHLRIGDSLQKETDMGPVINESQFNKILKYIEIGKKEGAKLILGGKAYQKGNCSKGYFIEPTLFIEVTPEMRIAQEEIFGPVVSVIEA